jgi:DNA-directed RNA polymerase specialized sigma24 family protein
VDQLAETYQGDPALYFYGVGRFLLLECQRREFILDVPLTTIKAAEPEPEEALDQESLKLACLESCLQNLSEEDRHLILLYYQREKSAKIGFRKELAKQIGSTTNALRVRVYRIRTFLHGCVSKCLEQHSYR